MGESVAGNNVTSPTEPPKDDVPASSKSNGFGSLNVDDGDDDGDYGLMVRNDILGLNQA